MEIDGSVIRHSFGITTGCPYFRGGRKYRLCRINLVRAGCPMEVLDDERFSHLLHAANTPVVIEKNRWKFGFVEATQCYPRVIVVSGLAQRNALLDAGNIRGWVWVENGAISMQADDVISAEELMSKLQALINQRYVKKGSDGIVRQPWIINLYPFENYAVFVFGGQKFRQPYSLNPIAREIALAKQPQPVKGKYVSVGDIMGCTVQRWSNPTEAVTMMLNDVTHGLYRVKYPARALPSGDGILAILAQAKISWPDFCCWSEKEQTDLTYKNIDGQRLPRSKFKAIDYADKSTWILRARRNRPE